MFDYDVESSLMQLDFGENYHLRGDNPFEQLDEQGEINDNIEWVFSHENRVLVNDDNADGTQTVNITGDIEIRDRNGAIIEENNGTNSFRYPDSDGDGLPDIFVGGTIHDRLTGRQVGCFFEFVQCGLPDAP